MHLSLYCKVFNNLSFELVTFQVPKLIKSRDIMQSGLEGTNQLLIEQEIIGLAKLSWQ